MVARDKIIKKLEEIKHWRDVYHRPTGSNVKIQNTSYDEKLQQCAIFISFEKNGNPEKKKVTYHESYLFDRLESDFEYDNSPIEIGREIVKPQIITTANIIQQPLEEKEKTITTLRDSLFNTLFKLQNGNITAEEAKTIAVVSQTIINTVKLEIEYKAKSGKPVKMLD